MVFYRDKRHIRGQPSSLQMGDSRIHFTERAKFLGLTFDTHLNWIDHINDLKARCLRRLAILKAVARVHWGADRPTLMLLYKAIVLSLLDYGCQIYGNATEAILQRLDSVHHAGIRISSGAFQSSRISSLLAESGELPLSFHRQMVTMKTAVRLSVATSIGDLFYPDRD